MVRFDKIFFDIDGAATFSEMVQVDEETWKFPQMNREYKHALFRPSEGVIWASKNGVEYVMAVCVEQDGITISANDLKGGA